MKFSGAIAGACMALMPCAAYALPIGGQVSQLLPCYNTAIYAYLGPPLGGPYIWIPATETFPNGAPSFIGQWVIGTALPPNYCLYSIAPVRSNAGLTIIMMGSSGY